MKHRYPGIHSFTADEQALFFGREREKKELFRLIVLNEIVVLFGKSGTGKTSLLQAGVGPLLTERHLQPVKVRLNNTQQPISRQIFEQLNDGDYLPLNTPDDLSLWEYCKRFEYAPGGDAFAPVLLLDQFEELFTLYHDQPEAQQDFISQLAAVLNHKIPARVQEAAQAIAGEAERAQWLAPPQVNIVISIRSDFLYLLDRLSARIPSILRCRYELPALDEANTRLAITRPPALGGPFASPVFSYSEAALQEMVDSLVTIDADNDAITPGAVREVEPFQAQLLCQHIEQKIIAEQRPDGFVVTPDFYAGRGGIQDIRKQYYDGVLARFDAHTRPRVERLLGEFLLSNDRRIIQERDYLLEKCTLREQDLALLCTERLLREEPRGGSYYYEISHDTLVAPITAAREERRQAEEAERLEQERTEAEHRAKEAEEKAAEDRRRAEEAERLRLEAERQRTIAQQATIDAEKERDKAQTALAHLETALAEIRVKNLSTFESFAGLGADLMYSLNYPEALAKMKVAADIEVDAGLKQQQLTEPIAELLYFFAESGRRLDLARTAAELLLQVNPDPVIVPLLQQCRQENWNARDQFAPLLKTLPFYHTLQARYYPEWCAVPLGADGTFDMGSESSEQGHQSDEQLHQVKLSPYQMAATPVTFYQFALYSEAVDRGLASRTPYWGLFGDHPAVNVNWYETAEYANWLNAQVGLPPAYRIQKEVNSDVGNQVQNDFLKWKVDWNNQVSGYRLPTEAEWELAARAGVGAPRTQFAGSDILDAVGWYWENSGDKPLSGDWDLNRIYDNNGRTHPVKQKKENGIGLYDMSGNVWEWCWDWYDAEFYNECQKQGIEQHPAGAKSSAAGRVVRGGSWYYYPEYCRVAFRNGGGPDYRNFNIGFRLVFVP
ncbi:MAG: SUMF1/EgtB/PvdO family nonheme iron enzyme [Saprospiraceae bacterium]|nr:SUMF1/EgtB/PvdO family nonheme iron enzyme [Saprospiraceae bacterium]